MSKLIILLGPCILCYYLTAVLSGLHMLFFQQKYLLMYGMPALIALFDRVNAPQTPICPLGVYSVKQMWRYFDRGLHDMLVRWVSVFFDIFKRS